MSGRRLVNLDATTSASVHSRRQRSTAPQRNPRRSRTARGLPRERTFWGPPLQDTQHHHGAALAPSRGAAACQVRTRYAQDDDLAATDIPLGEDIAWGCPDPGLNPPWGHCRDYARGFVPTTYMPIRGRAPSSPPTNSAQPGSLTTHIGREQHAQATCAESHHVGPHRRPRGRFGGCRELRPVQLEEWLPTECGNQRDARIPHLVAMHVQGLRKLASRLVLLGLLPEGLTTAATRASLSEHPARRDSTLGPGVWPERHRYGGAARRPQQPFGTICAPSKSNCRRRSRVARLSSQPHCGFSRSLMKN